MRELVVDFSAALKSAGVEVSPAETLDAARALVKCGYASRDVMRSVLRTTCVKNIEDEEEFDRVFEAFFATGEEGANAEAGQGTQSDIEQLESLLSGNQQAAEGESEGAPGIAQQLERASKGAQLDRMQYSTQKNVFLRRVLDQTEFDQLEAELRQLEQDGKGDGMRAAMLRTRMDMLRQGATTQVTRAFELYGDRGGKRLRAGMLRNMDVNRIDRAYYQDVLTLVRKLAKRLVKKHRHSATRGKAVRLDTRRTMHKAAGSDWVPFHLQMRRRRKRAPQVIVVCDISGSMRASARFFLMFVYALVEAVGDIRSFVFSSNCAEVTHNFRNMNVASAIEKALKDHGGGSTDYNCALRELNEQVAKHVHRDTAVLILGDARNNHGPTGSEHLQEIAGRGGRMLWLNPEMRIRWGTGDSVMPTYDTIVSQSYQVGNLRQFEGVLDELLHFCDRVWRS